MGAKDDTEKVLRDIHVLFSKAKPYNNSKVNVVVNREEAMELLKELSKSMNKMMEEYEMTKASRERAARKQQKKADEKAAESKRRAEDVYAASIIYMDQTLMRIQDIIRDANSQMEALAEETKESFEKEAKTVRANQSELRGQLQDFIDTEKYLHIIEDENRRIEKEKAAEELTAEDAKTVPLSEVMSEIRVNPQFIPGYEGEDFLSEELLSEEEAEEKSLADEPEYPKPEIIVKDIPKTSPIRSITEDEEIPDFGEKKADPDEAPEIQDYGFDWKELDGEDNHDEAVDRVLSLFGKKKK